MTMELSSMLMEMMEARWREAHRLAEAARGELEALTSDADLARRNDLRARLEYAQTTKEDVLREIDAVEDALTASDARRVACLNPPTCEPMRTRPEIAA